MTAIMHGVSPSAVSSRGSGVAVPSFIDSLLAFNSDFLLHKSFGLESAPGVPAVADDSIERWLDPRGVLFGGQLTEAEKPYVGEDGAPTFDGFDDDFEVPVLGGPDLPQTVIFRYALTDAITDGQSPIPISLAGLEVCLVNYAGYQPVSFINSSNGVCSGFTAAGALTVSGYHTVAVRYDGGDKAAPASYRAWFDGAEQTVVASAGLSGGSVSQIGARGAFVLPGPIEAVAVWESAQSSATIEAFCALLSA